MSNPLRAGRLGGLFWHKELRWGTSPAPKREFNARFRFDLHFQWVDSPNQSFQRSFSASLRIDFQGSRVTSDGGLILMRELDERLGFGELIQQHLTDSLFPRVGFIVTNLTCPAARWCGSTTSEAPPSTGSRKASRR